MQVMAVTFYDENGMKQIGELINASTIIHKDERSMETQIDRHRPDEVIIFTTDGEWMTHTVLIGNVTNIRPLEV